MYGNQSKFQLFKKKGFYNDRSATYPTAYERRMNLENIRRHEMDIQEESGYSVNDLDTTMENGSLDNSRILTGRALYSDRGEDVP